MQTDSPLEMAWDLAQQAGLVMLMMKAPHIAMGVLGKGWDWVSKSGKFKEDIANGWQKVKDGWAKTRWSSGTSKADDVAQSMQSVEETAPPAYAAQTAPGADAYAAKQQGAEAANQAAKDDFIDQNPEAWDDALDAGCAYTRGLAFPRVTRIIRNKITYNIRDGCDFANELEEEGNSAEVEFQSNYPNSSEITENYLKGYNENSAKQRVNPDDSFGNEQFSDAGEALSEQAAQQKEFVENNLKTVGDQTDTMMKDDGVGADGEPLKGPDGKEVSPEDDAYNQARAEAASEVTEESTGEAFETAVETFAEAAI